jgi:hypothetical protein
MRTFSGVTVGMIGGLIGIHASLSLSAAVLFVVLGGLMVFQARNRAPAPVRPG